MTFLLLQSVFDSIVLRAEAHSFVLERRTARACWGSAANGTGNENHKNQKRIFEWHRRVRPLPAREGAKKRNLMSISYAFRLAAQKAQETGESSGCCGATGRRRKMRVMRRGEFIARSTQ